QRKSPYALLPWINWPFPLSFYVFSRRVAATRQPGRSIWRGSRMHSGLPLAAAPFLGLNPSTLNEKLNVDVKEFRQFSCLRFADRALAVKHLGGNAL